MNTRKLIFIGIALLATGVIIFFAIQFAFPGAMPAKMNGNFPSTFYHEAMREEWPQSFYITDAAFLDSREAEQHDIPEHYISFFKDPGSAIRKIAGASKSRSFAKWLETLPKKTMILERHYYDPALFGQADDHRYGIQFTDLKSFEEWKNNWPSFGITIALHDAQELSHLPEPLKEIYRFGQIHLYCFQSSGNFLAPAEIKPISGMKDPDGEYLRECAEHYQERSDTAMHLDQLRPFYDDSGCYLLVDQNENVWVGGVECGDLYGTTLKLQDVLDRMFELLQTKPVLYISDVVPEKHWKEKN